MATEIERKFLVKANTWRTEAQGVPYIQGYLNHDPHSATVRVRIAGQQAYLTIKGKVVNLTRAEFEYPIPMVDARQMLENLCAARIVEKVRYRIQVSSLVWEVDEFGGLNQGLVLAEVELSSPDQPITYPDWVGAEVSQDPRYFNSYLATTPFSTW